MAIRGIVLRVSSRVSVLDLFGLDLGQIGSFLGPSPHVLVSSFTQNVSTSIQVTLHVRQSTGSIWHDRISWTPQLVPCCICPSYRPQKGPREPLAWSRVAKFIHQSSYSIPVSRSCNSDLSSNEPLTIIPAASHNLECRTIVVKGSVPVLPLSWSAPSSAYLIT
jgi:hypothetical protein